MIAASVFAFQISGCASTGNKELSKMETHSLSETFVKGKTTSAEVRSQFGEPSDIDFDSTGRQKWTYSHTKSTSKVSNFIPIVSLFKSGSNDLTKKVVIIFDKEDKIADYMATQSKGETKIGILG